MAVAEKIKSIESYPQSASQEFRDQLERVGSTIAKQASTGMRGSEASKGVDRSREFSPVARPSIVRSLANR